MVINFGFSDIGPWSLASPGAQSQDMIMRMMAQNEVSEQLQEDIDRNIKKIVDECYEEAKVSSRICAVRQQKQHPSLATPYARGTIRDGDQVLKGYHERWGPWGY